MPSTRTYKTRNRRLEGPGVMNRHVRHYLEHGTLPTPADVRDDDPPVHDVFEVFTLAGDEARLRQVWRDVHVEILKDWIRERPGARPWAWWQFDSPPEQRRRVGGVGMPLHECLAYAPTWAFGLPSSGWLDPWLRDYYRGTARAVHGTLVNPKARHRKPPFRGAAFDKHDPPTYESQATYLERHKFLSDDERRRLPATAFEPEVIPVPEDDDDVAT